MGSELVNGDAMDSSLVCGIGGIMICSWKEADTAKGRMNARRCDRRMMMRLVTWTLGALELQADSEMHRGDRKLPCGQVIRS